mgnify:CR=1 FL=1
MLVEGACIRGGGRRRVRSWRRRWKVKGKEVATKEGDG